MLRYLFTRPYSLVPSRVVISFLNNYREFSVESFRRINFDDLNKIPKEELEFLKENMILNRYEIESEYDPVENRRISLKYYRRIIQKLREQLANDKNSFKMTLSIVKKQFIRNANLQDQQSIEHCFAHAEEYLHRLRARSLHNEKPSTFDRYGKDKTAEEQQRLEELEVEVARQNIEQGPEYWNQYYQQQGSIDESYCDYEVLKKYLQPLNKTKSTKVLIVGCGVSSLGANMFGRKSCEIYEIDYSEVAVKYMNELYKFEGLGHLLMDVRKLEFPNEMFDLVVDKATFDTIMVAEEGEEDVQLMGENIWNVLKPGGVFFLVSVTPVDGIRAIFSGNPWLIEKLGALDLTTRDVIDGASEEEKNQDYESSVEESLARPMAHFYTLTKPTII